jgi:hypothetical protein
VLIIRVSPELGNCIRDFMIVAKDGSILGI